MPSHENRKASLSEEEKLAVLWLLKDGLSGVERLAEIFLAGPAAPTNGEIDTILEGDTNALAGMLRQKALTVFAAPNVSNRGVQLLTACSPYLTPDEREHALDLVKRTCQSPSDDYLLSEALAGARRFGLALWPDDGFRQALCRLVDHKRWAIADLAAELLATGGGSA